MAKKKVAISYGHGKNTFEDQRSKFVIIDGKVYEEHTFNAKLGVIVKERLEDHGIAVLEVQPANGLDVALRSRTDRANTWGADLYWSIHANAATPTVKGVAGFYWSTSKESKKVADIFAKHLKAGKFDLYGGGAMPSVKGTWSDFHECRETNMPALLTENGFMTNAEDFKRIFKNEGEYYQRLAEVHVKTICEYLGVTYKAPAKAPEKAPEKPAVTPNKPVSKTQIHRVIVDGKQVGAYGNDANVVEAVEKALKAGAKKVEVEKV